MEIPSPSNPLGVRAGGESGTTPALAAFIAGWQSVMGPGPPIPSIPGHSVPAGTTAYLRGIRWAYRRRRSERPNRRAKLQIRTLPTAVLCAPFRRTCRIMRWGPDDGFDLRKFTHAAGSRRCIRHRFLHATAQLFHRTAATRLQGPLLVLLPSSGWRWWLRICRGLPRKHRNLSGLSSSLSSSFDLRTNRAAKADVRIRRRGRQGGLSKDTTTKIRGPCCVVKEIVLTRSS